MIASKSSMQYDSNKSYKLFECTLNGNVNVLKELQQEEAEELLSYTRNIWIFDLLSSRIAEIKMNYQDFQNGYHQGFKHDFPDKLSYTIVRDDMSRVFNANRLCKNYVFSWRCYVDLLAKDISDLYSETREIGTAFALLTNEYFDKYFEYRFTYQLRNMGSHIETMIPIAHYNNDGTFDPCFDKQLLIETKIFKDKHFKQDFIVLPKYISSKAIIDRSMSVIGKFHDEVLSILKDLILTHSKKAIQYQDNFGENRIGYGTISTIKSSEKLNYRFHILPYEMAKKAIEYYENPQNDN